MNDMPRDIRSVLLSAEDHARAPPIFMTNVVSSFSIGRRDISQHALGLALRHPGIVYKPGCFAPVMVRFDAPMMVLQNGGSVVGPSARSPEDSLCAAHMFINFLLSNGIYARLEDFRVTNIAANASVDYEIDLRAFANAFGPSVTYFESGHPGARLLMPIGGGSGNVSISVYISGSVNVVGTRCVDDMQRAWTWFSLYVLPRFRMARVNKARTSSSEYRRRVLRNMQSLAGVCKRIRQSTTMTTSSMRIVPKPMPTTKSTRTLAGHVASCPFSNVEHNDLTTLYNVYMWHADDAHNAECEASASFSAQLEHALGAERLRLMRVHLEGHSIECHLVAAATPHVWWSARHALAASAEALVKYCSSCAVAQVGSVDAAAARVAAQLDAAINASRVCK